jgi:hypothetical protein
MDLVGGRKLEERGNGEKASLIFLEGMSETPQTPTDQLYKAVTPPTIKQREQTKQISL